MLLAVDVDTDTFKVNRDRCHACLTRLRAGSVGLTPPTSYPWLIEDGKVGRDTAAHAARMSRCSWSPVNSELPLTNQQLTPHNLEAETHMAGAPTVTQCG